MTVYAAGSGHIDKRCDSYWSVAGCFRQDQALEDSGHRAIRAAGLDFRFAPGVGFPVELGRHMASAAVGALATPESGVAGAFALLRIRCWSRLGG
jgi:hypothetical protein